MDSVSGIAPDQLPNSALPNQYTITIEVDWTQPDATILKLFRFNREIYSDRFPNVHDAFQRALFEIRIDQSRSRQVTD